MLNKVVVFDFFAHKGILIALSNYGCSTDVTRTVFPPSGSGNVSVALLSMERQRALGFHQKYLNLCFEDERRSYGFGTTRG